MEREENGLLNINVNICDRPYRLKIRPDEEENVRKAARNISDKVKYFQEQYGGKDKQDYIAMTALMLAVENMNRNIEKAPEVAGLSEQLELLDMQIQKALKG